MQLHTLKGILSIGGGLSLGTSPGTTNLISWWSMNEDTTADRVDSHGSNDLTPDVGGVASESGKQGNAVDFDGTNHLRNAATTGIVSGSNDHSWAGWFKLDAYPGGTDIDVFFGLTSGAPSSPSGIAYFLKYDDAADNFEWQVNVSTSTHKCPASTFGAATLGAWVFIYMENDFASRTLGISINNGTKDTLGYTGTPNAKTVLDVGRMASSFPYNVTGSIDELCHFDRLLTADEITFLYQGGSGVTYGDL